MTTNSPLGNALPSFRGYADITVRELLNHLEASRGRSLLDYLRLHPMDETRAYVLAFLRNLVHVKKEKAGGIVLVYTGTVKKYAQVLVVFFNSCRQPVSGVRSYHIADLINKELSSGKAVNTVNLKIRALRSFFKFLHSNGFIKANPTVNLKDIKGGRKYHSSHFLSFDEAGKIMNHVRGNCSVRDQLIFSVMRYAGVRAEETVSLRWGDLERNNISGAWQLKIVGKGNKERTVPILQNLAKDLLKYREQVFSVLPEHENVPGLSKTPMFGHHRDPFKPLSTSFLYKLVSKYGWEVLGKKISPHWFRHTFATHAGMKEVDIKAISHLLGHTSIQTTMNYEHSFQLQQGKYGEIFVDEYQELEDQL
jgi:integrase/recombinase XerC